MNLLLVVPYLPHEKIPYAGGQVVYHELRHLSKWHRITLITAAHPSDQKAVETLRPFCEEIHTVLQTRTFGEKVWQMIRSLPLALLHPSVLKPRIRRAYDLTRAMHRLLKTKSFDIIQMEFSDTARFLHQPLFAASVLMPHDVLEKPARRRLNLGRGPARWLRKAVYRYTLRLEGRIVRLFDRVIAHSDFDGRLLKNLYPGISIEALQLGLTRRFTGANNPKGKDLLFVGAMNREVNVQSVLFTVQEILPRVWSEYPEVTFTIVGGDPRPEVLQLARRDERIKVTGFASELEPYYASAYAFVAPLFVGGGIIIKIVEALSAGLPVVTTPVGNEGIEAEAGEEIMVGTSADELAEGCKGLLRDRDYRDRLGEKGRAFAERKYSWDAATEFLNRQYEEILAARRTRREGSA
ncbi:MAG: glycosyltransferase [Calditrichaeota bacterium]|nr:glycosyltransferase [Calditrichota bacterium]